MGQSQAICSLTCELRRVICLRGFLYGSAGEESTFNVGDTGDAGFILGLGRSPGGGNGNALQYAYLKSPADRGAWWATAHSVAKSQT